MKNMNLYHLVLIIVILFCGFNIALENLGSISGKALSLDVFSNLSLDNYYAIDFSENLSAGILFGTIQFFPADDVNASHNYDGISNGSSFYANVSSDGNTNVDFCIRANGGLKTFEGDEIGIGNETYTYFNFTNLTYPLSNPKIQLNTSYVPSGTSLFPGETNYWRFWLDVPIGQPTGSYNNTVQIKGIATGDGCYLKYSKESFLVFLIRWKKLLLIFLIVGFALIFADVVGDSPSEVYIFNFQIFYTNFDGDTTDFYSYNQTELENLSFVVLERTSYGKIEFNENLDLISMAGIDGVVDFDSDISIEDDVISVDEVDLPGISKSVNLSLYGLSYSDPEIYHNGIICSTCELISYSGGTLVFSDISFNGIYYAREKIVPPFCGDGSCNGDETCETCSQDCGECSVEPPTGGDIPPVIDPTQGGTYDFILDPTFFTLTMDKGTYYKRIINIENNGTVGFPVVVRVDPEISQFIFPEQVGFFLPVDGSRDLGLDIYISNRMVADVYFGKISFIYGGLTKVVEVVLDVREKDALFDIKTEVLKKYINPGGRIRANVTIINMGDVRDFDVSLEYMMIDFDKNIYTTKKEDFAMNRTHNGTYFLDVPNDASPGNYLFFTRVSYGDINASSYDTFTVETISSIAWVVLLFFLLVLILLIYIWYKYKKEDFRYKAEQRKIKKEAEEAVSGNLKLPEKKKIEVPELP